MEKKFYVTTPIYYPNDVPHIGHAYTTIVADALARWNRLKGNKVYFLTGTDDHGKKIAEAAEKVGKSPKEFVDNLVPKFKEAWKKLNIEYNRFIRTTDKDHEKLVKEMLQKAYDLGDIYLGEYEGLYCIGCEAYYTEKDLVDGCCPIHKRPVENVKEESYFFRLSKYQKRLLDLYKKNPKFISPKNRKQEVINRVKEGLKDLSISRTSFDWGIQLPFNKKHVCYVWFDALFNYLSGAGKNREFWPADIHLIGKDITWFHTVYWPAFLMSVGEDLPKQVFAHGWWTFDKEKISKSRGKVINIDELIGITGNKDSVRYFLLRATPFGDDGDFSNDAMIIRHNNELANKLGNLVSRVSGLIEKIGIDKEKNKKMNRLIDKRSFNEIDLLMKNFEVDKSLNKIFSLIDKCNEYVQKRRIWETKNKTELYAVGDAIKKISILLWPFIPETSEKIAGIFGDWEFSRKEFEIPLDTEAKIRKSEPLFVKVEEEKINKEEKIIGVMDSKEVGFDEWSKLDIRVAKVEKIEDIPGADKLYKLSLDVGELGKRTICAGLKPFYPKDKILGRKIIYLSNLKPRMMKGIESQGMLLAATSDNHSKVSILMPSEDIEVGSRIS